MDKEQIAKLLNRAVNALVDNEDFTELFTDLVKARDELWKELDQDKRSIWEMNCKRVEDEQGNISFIYY